MPTTTRVSRPALLNGYRFRKLQVVAPGEHVASLRDGQRAPMTRRPREVGEPLRSV